MVMMLNLLIEEVLKVYLLKKEGDLGNKKVTFRIEEGEVNLLKVKYNTENQSEAIRLAIIECSAF